MRVRFSSLALGIAPGQSERTGGTAHSRLTVSSRGLLPIDGPRVQFRFMLDHRVPVAACQFQEVARRFKVSRQSVHSWLRRYAADQGLGDRSSRPRECPIR
jgi:hypothetical protein